MRPLRMMGAVTRATDESAADSGGSTSAEAHGDVIAFLLFARRFTLSVDVCVCRAVAEDEGRGEPDAVVAGATLFAVYLRRCIEEPELDLTEGVGFLKTHFRSEHCPLRAPLVA